MGNLNSFLKQNKVKRENVKYAATKSLCDEKGKPLEWTIKPLTSREIDDIREACIIDVQVKGRPGLFRQKTLNHKLVAKVICASVVEPNLNSKELQDSYGVMSAEELIKEMVDNPGEYTAFYDFISELNTLNESLEDKVDEAKN